MYYYLAALLFFSSHLFYGAQQTFKPFLDKHVNDIITVYDKGFLPFLRLVVMQIYYNSGYEYHAFVSLNAHQNREKVEWIKTTPGEAFDYFNQFEKEYHSKVHKTKRVTICS